MRLRLNLFMLYPFGCSLILKRTCGGRRNTTSRSSASCNGRPATGRRHLGKQGAKNLLPVRRVATRWTDKRRTQWPVLWTLGRVIAASCHRTVSVLLSAREMAPTHKLTLATPAVEKLKLIRERYLRRLWHKPVFIRSDGLQRPAYQIKFFASG